MYEFALGLRELISHWLSERQAPKEYWIRISKALGEFANDTQRKKFSSRLARQVLISSTFAGFLFAKLNELKAPAHIRWISDRDGAFERYNELALDLSYIFFQLLRPAGDLPANSDRPQFLFAYPMMDGTQDYAEQIRLPDYLAGLCADIKIPEIKFTHTKFNTIFDQVFINSTNNVLIEVLGNQEKLTTRRLSFKA